MEDKIICFAFPSEAKSERIISAARERERESKSESCAIIVELKQQNSNFRTTADEQRAKHDQQMLRSDEEELKTKAEIAAVR